MLAALNPLHGVSLLRRARAWPAFLTLGAVFLAVTGAEALYADMGHFGRAPIRIAWFALVLPALVAQLPRAGRAAARATRQRASNPFLPAGAGWALYPLVALATMATVIASQALISGAFSLTQQAMQLGYSPRFDIHHTSAHEKGQVYIPEVNWMLMSRRSAWCSAFRTSTNLAAAYGMAVTDDDGDHDAAGVRGRARALGLERCWRAGAITAAFLAIDLAFFARQRHEDRAWRLVPAASSRRASSR